MVFTVANRCEHVSMRGSGVRDKIPSLDGTDDGGGGGGCDEAMEPHRDEDKVQDSKSKSCRGGGRMAGWGLFELVLTLSVAPN